MMLVFALAALAKGRKHLNATLLPDRTVLVTGGSGRNEAAPLATNEAEVYDPGTDTWRTLATASTAGSISCSLSVRTCASVPKTEDSSLGWPDSAAWMYDRFIRCFISSRPVPVQFSRSREKAQSSVPLTC